jgi:hypothetical protein
LLTFKSLTEEMRRNPDYPKELPHPTNDPERFALYREKRDRMSEGSGVGEAFNAMDKADQLAGKAMRAAMKSPARTARGAAAKIRLAIGADVKPHGCDNPENLTQWNDTGEPWVASVARDLEAMARRDSRRGGRVRP